MFPIILTHVLNFWFGYHGRSDQYILTVMIHCALLVNGAQLIHLIRPSRRSTHRWLFFLNTVCTATEFIVAYVSASRPDWNQRFCPKFIAALEDSQGTRIKYTIPPLALSILLSLVDMVTAFLEDRRRKQIEIMTRRSGLSTSVALSSFHPYSIGDFHDRESMKKRVICGTGLVLFIASVFNLEYFVIRNFHRHMQSAGFLSGENNWSFGQVLPPITASVFFLYMIRKAFEPILTPYILYIKGDYWIPP